MGPLVGELLARLFELRQFLELALHGGELGVVRIARVVAAYIGDGLGITEARQGIDMAVGIVAFEMSVAEPQHPVDAQRLGQPGLDIGP